MAQLRNSNVCLVEDADKRNTRVFVDGILVSGVLNVSYECEPGERPSVLLRIFQPMLAARKPRVRRKCLTRPHVA